jgi:hypothetical protein
MSGLNDQRVSTLLGAALRDDRSCGSRPDDEHIRRHL